MAEVGPTQSRRSAPRRGYDTPSKQKYREAVWAALGKDAAALSDNDSVVILPSSEGLEIDTAVRAGVAPERIIAVDKSAAIIATAKWRQRWKVGMCCGVNVGRLGERLSPWRHRVVVANLDLCGTVNQGTVAEVRGFMEGVPLADDIRLAVTVAKGREDPLVAMLMNRIRREQTFSDNRMDALMHLVGLVNSDEWRLSIIDEGSYLSGKHPMTWAAMRLQRWNSWFEAMSADVGPALRNLCYAFRIGCRNSHDQGEAVNECWDAFQRHGMTNGWNATRYSLPEALSGRFDSLMPRGLSHLARRLVDDHEGAWRDAA